MQLVVYSGFSLLVIYSWFSLLLTSTRGIYKNQYHHTVTILFYHAHRDIVQTSDTTLISTTTSTTSITIRDIEE
eukprot:scaffold133755_cov83-Attheya_sp.AAC.2